MLIVAEVAAGASDQMLKRVEPAPVVSDSMVLVRFACGATVPTISAVPPLLPIKRNAPPARLMVVESGKRSLLLAAVLSRIRLAAVPTVIVAKFLISAPLVPRKRTAPPSCVLAAPMVKAPVNVAGPA